MSMFRRRSLRALAVSLLASGVLIARAAEAQVAAYSGQATAVRAEVLGVTTVLSDTGPLPSSGGSLSASQASATIPGLLTAGVLTANATGAGDQSHADSSVANLALTVAGNTITADVLTSEATASCGPEGPAITGGSQVLNLVVNGTPIVVTGAPNQTIPLPGGTGQIVINEQQSSVSGNSADLTVNALHVTVTGIADVVIAHSHADVVCGAAPPCFNGITYSGQATVVRGTVLGSTTVLADTGPLPCSGGSLSSSLVSAAVPGLLTADVLSASTSGGGTQSESEASLADLSLTVGDNTVTATLVQSETSATCGPDGTASVAGDSVVLSLVINGTPITVTGMPNQTVPLPGGVGQVIINEQQSTVSGSMGEITVNALHVIVTDVGDVVVSSSYSDIACAPLPNTYSGDAAALDATVLGVRTIVSQAGPLPCSGGTDSSSLPTVTVPGLLTASALSSSTTAGGTQSTSEASIANATLTVGGNTITATVLSSEATASCGPGPMVSGDSVVLELVINGTPITVTGMPNQTIPLPGGTGQVVINEQTSIVSGNSGDITVNALHVVVNNVADVRVSSSHADITCGAQPLTCCPNGVVDPGEDCDPPGSNTCPGSVPPQCNADCTCPAALTTTTTSTSTTSTLACPGLDHFKCYRSSGFARPAPRPVSLVDQFGATSATVTKPIRLCNPADKNGEGIDDATAHLMCYALKETGFVPRDVVVTNQFGQQTLNVVKPQQLCLPAIKNGVPSALDIDHFKCYRARGKRGTPTFAPRTVTVADQFEIRTVSVVKPLFVCNPVDKNGEGIGSPACHLTCYRIVDRGTEFEPRPVNVEDQFTSQDLTSLRGECRRSALLCLPSDKSEL